MHLNWRPQTSASNIPPFLQNSSFPAASSTDQLKTCYKAKQGTIHHLEGARQEEPLHLQTQHCNAASKQLSRPHWSKLKKKQKTQTTNKTKALHHIQFPNTAITNPYSHPWAQIQNQCAASAGLGCCLIALHILSERTTLLIVLGNIKRECNFYGSSPNSVSIPFCYL